MAKREKHVFSGRHDVTHAWAHQVASYGKRSDGRVFFEAASGEYPKAKAVSTIYSYGYHFPIATMYERKDGVKFVLFTTQSYSSSTGGHKNAVWYSVNHMKRFLVNSPRDPHHAKDDFKNRIVAETDAAKNPKAKRIQAHMDRAKELVREGNELAQMFGFRWKLKEPKFTPELEAHAAELETKYEAQQKARAEKQAIREAERRRINQLSIEQRIAEWRLDPKIPLPWGYEERFTDEDRALYAKREQDKIDAWRSGSAGVDAVFRAPEVYLRVKDDNIETSKGARFPIEHGIKAWPVVKRCHDRNEGWETNGHSVNLGHYHIDKIQADGTVIAGCHRVGFGEVERIAKELGLT